MVKIFIDPGHGGSNIGAEGNGMQEKDIVLDISKRIVTQLSDYSGVETRMSRKDDRFVSLSDRAEQANTWGADYFISVHVNAAGGSGFETYIWSGDVPEETTRKQGVMHAAIIDEINETDRGKKRADFAVLRETSMPAILTENLFIDDPDDAAKLADSDFLEQIAQGHTNGIVTLYQLDENGSGEVDEQDDDDTLSQGTMSTIQSTLNNRYDLSIAVDNIYGPETESALIKALQRELNSQFNRDLKVDGIWGPNTRRAVINVRRGAQGNITWMIQATLFGKGFPPGQIDGIYGPQTEASVREFQEYEGITVDGIVGRETFSAMFG
ncbi:N-acetylmuramoyl-L-alanine amidase [Salipaludibacillus daqingensis]|uniref:N-acetylmuramoyl-L-alanine amidase n=1 Tax=Salipaludibacillus daqingensis TaxID=3041001 RepID=UPI0024731198|nr:N-acetylmuramoyl-L-alanine amidase [Salipaludibacillus daqingensis]